MSDTVFRQFRQIAEVKEAAREIERLRSEIERLRAALEEIEKSGACQCEYIARAALEGK